MKRYNMVLVCCGDDTPMIEQVESKEGAWVKWEEVMLLWHFYGALEHLKHTMQLIELDLNCKYAKQEDK